MSDRRSLLEANLWKLNAFNFFQGMWIFIPIFVLFLQDNGLSLHQVFILESIYAIVQFVLEIPSGYLSDRWGRVRTTIAGSVLFFISLTCIAIGTTFWMFVVGFVLWAVHRSLLSGTLAALTYDTLLELGQTERYRAIAGHQLFLRFSSEAAAGIIGGLVAVFSLRLSFWLTLIPTGIACLIALLLEEPQRQKLQETRHVRFLVSLTKDTLLHRPTLRYIILLQSIVFFLGVSLYFLRQPYQAMVGLPLSLFGVMHAVIVIAGAFASKYAHTVERWVRDSVFLPCVAVTMIVSYLALGAMSSLWMLGFFVLARIAWMFTTPVTSEMMNRMTTSDKRATVLSIGQFMSRIIHAAAMPLIGAAADLYSLQTALLATGAIGGLGLAIILVLMQKRWDEIPPAA